MNTYNTQLTTKNSLRSLLALSIIFLFGSIFTVQAQNTDASDGVAQGDAAGVSVKLIDNKGTIKYLQSNNGITTVTSTEADNKTTTTWQLGGSLLEDTYIDVEGNVFSLDGLKLETGAAAATSTTATGHDAGTNTTAVPATDTGWTLVVRDEQTGELRKLLATSLVTGIRKEYEQTADSDFDIANPTATTTDVVIAVAGLPNLGELTTAAKLFVYRNGAKLRFNTDFKLVANATNAGDFDVVITPSADIPMYKDDIIEIQYIK